MVIENITARLATSQAEIERRPHQPAMADAVESLILDLVEWVGRKERTYRDTMEAWRTSCPRLPVWEDATDLGLVERVFAKGRSTVQVTAAGWELLKARRPDDYSQLRGPDSNSSV